MVSLAGQGSQPDQQHLVSCIDNGHGAFALRFHRRHVVCVRAGASHTLVVDLAAAEEEPLLLVSDDHKLDWMRYVYHDELVGELRGR